MQEMDEEEELERERERKSGKFRDHEIRTVRVKDWFFAEQEMAGRKSWRSKGERVRERCGLDTQGVRVWTVGSLVYFEMCGGRKLKDRLKATVNSRLETWETIVGLSDGTSKRT
jgi:hypothetical protein